MASIHDFKIRREDFIRKHFPFPESLEVAIQKSAPKRFSNHHGDENPLTKLRQIDHPNRIRRLLELDGYHQHFNWSYAYKENFCISDWCALHWLFQSGLWVHFEWMSIGCMSDPLLQVEMDDESWEFLFAKRKIILGNFCGGRLVAKYREEDFSALLMIAGEDKEEKQP